MEWSLTTVLAEMDFIISFTIIFFFAAWVLAAELPISGWVRKTTLNCIKVVLKFFPAWAKLAVVWPLMLFHMLLEVSSELAIDATVLTSKWPDIHLQMVLEKEITHVRLQMDSQIRHTVRISSANALPTNEWALLWPLITCLQKNKNEFVEITYNFVENVEICAFFSFLQNIFGIAAHIFNNF